MRAVGSLLSRDRMMDWHSGDNEEEEEEEEEEEREEEDRGTSIEDEEEGGGASLCVVAALRVLKEEEDGAAAGREEPGDPTGSAGNFKSPLWPCIFPYIRVRASNSAAPTSSSPEDCLCRS